MMRVRNVAFERALGLSTVGGLDTALPERFPAVVEPVAAR
jgi:hypothetical protein